MSKQETSIYEKLFSLQQEIGAISKDKENNFYKNKYFDINKLIDQLMPLFVKHNLLLLQPIEDGKQYSRIINISDGEMVESALHLPLDIDAQKMGGAITYYRRYTLVALLGLQAEDDDGNLASGKAGHTTNLNEKPF